MARKRIVVFASGRGSNAEAIYEASRNGTVNGDVVMVFSDRSQAAVLRKAASWGVPAFAADPGGFSSRKAYDEALLRAVLPYRPDLICLAGYMRICGAELVQAFSRTDYEYSSGPPSQVSADFMRSDRLWRQG